MVAVLVRREKLPEPDCFCFADHESDGVNQFSGGYAGEFCRQSRTAIPSDP